MNETGWLRIVGAVCITLAYVTAVIKGFDGILFTAYTNGLICLVLLSPAAIKKLLGGMKT